MHSAMTCAAFMPEELLLNVYMSLQETLIPEGWPVGDIPTAHSQFDILKSRQLFKKHPSDQI